MAELAVRTAYTNPARALSLATLKLTFPFWGVGFPVASIIIAIGSYFAFAANGKITTSESVVLSGSFALLLLFITGLLAVRWLSNDTIEVSKDGLRMPYIPLKGRLRLPWNSINRISLNSAPAGNEKALPDKEKKGRAAEPWREKELVIYTTNKGKEYISFSHMTPETVEKLILSIEMWGTGIEIDESVLELKQAIAAGGNSNSALPALPGNLSYTEMWEEELSRRFCPTAFVPLEPGMVLRNGTLKVLRHLALGGLSAVYLCQLDERQLVVLKEAVVADDATESAQDKAREMLDREAAMLLKLKHDNIVKVMDYFVEQKRNYLMLEYINGQDLRQLVKQNGPQSESTVVTWALTMTSILKYLHEQDPPLIHRDFTPDNLVLSPDGSIIVIDFGAANEFIGNATGTFVGKHAFIAPEQFRGKAVVQSDIYALGCTLFFLLTGKEPEALSTSDPREHVPDLSKELAEIVVSCTQMESKDRYQSAAQLMPVLARLAS